MAFILGAAALAVSAASAAAGYVGQQQAARRANAHAAAVDRANMEYRYEVMRYQNDVWAQDLAYAREVLSYSREEFTKQTEWAQRALDAAEKNRNADAFTIMVRGIEETIASAFQTTNVQRAGQAARAQFRARERGVEGNSTDAVLEDIWRQEGEAVTMVEENRRGTLRQLEREGIALDAQADQQMFQIASSMRTFAPNAPIRTPSPVSPVNPTAPVAGPSPITLATGLFNAGVQGLSTYNSLTGQNAKQTFDQVSAWAARTFRLGS